LRGTGKQLILMRVKEPRVRLSLAGARRGRFERALAASDLPLPPEGAITVENLVGPRVITLEIDRKAHRDLRVAVQVTGQPASGFAWTGNALLDPALVRVTGPEQVLLALDSVSLSPVRLDGKRDTVSAMVAPERLPDWCRADPALVHVQLPLLHHGH
jgi:YbbR domain-containing protein